MISLTACPQITLVACGHGDSAVGRAGGVVRVGDSLPVRPEMHA
jgi:hypothetical protein